MFFIFFRNYEHEEELPVGKMSCPNPNALKHSDSGSPSMSTTLECFDCVRSIGVFSNGWNMMLSVTDEKDGMMHCMVAHRIKAILVGATAGHGH